MPETSPATKALTLTAAQIPALAEITEFLDAPVILQDTPRFDGVDVSQDDDQPGCVWIETTDHRRWFRIDADGTWGRI